MSVAFPFGLPGASALYLGIYVITLGVHVVFLSYVLSGAGWVAVATASGRGRGPVASLLRDWLPFALGAAITAGVAPLLFVQILYQERFYTANLLLFHRWMAIVPVLIVGFYALYLGKSERVAGWGRPARTAVAAVAWGAFLFTAWSFTENHLLALDRGAWVDFYAQGRMLYQQAGLAPRLGIWIGGALPVMAVAVGWQLRAAAARGAAHSHSAAAGPPPAVAVRSPDELARAVRPLALVALSGLAVAAGAALLYHATLGAPARAALAGSAARPWLAIAAVGVAVQAVVWLAIARSGAPGRGLLIAASAAAGLTILGVAATRECLRLAAVDIAALEELHARAAAAGGLPIFLLFFALNAAAIGWCFAIVKRGLRSGNC